jgi:hypothetical protein
MARERKESEYSKLLRDPRWQQIRLRVFERDGWRCRGCSSKTNTLAVHHLFYVKGRKPWEYDLADLMTLCEDCHNMEYEERRGFEEELLEALKVLGWLADDIDMLTWAIKERKITPQMAFDMTVSGGDWVDGYRADLSEKTSEPPSTQG